MNKQKGFTLIELLVVIAIIGILSGIVLTSLNTARSKAKTARITSIVAQMRTMMEAHADSAGAYQEITETLDPNFAQMDADVTAQGGNLVQELDDAGTKYCVYATYVGTTGLNWCVDSSGHSAQYEVVPSTCATDQTCE